MARPARERVQQGRTVPAVPARQDVRGISSPEQNPLAPQLRCPGRIDLCAMGKQPATDYRFSKLRAFLPRGGRGEVAQPRKALQRLGQWTVRAHLDEVQIGKGERVPPTGKAASEQA